MHLFDILFLSRDNLETNIVKFCNGILWWVLSLLTVWVDGGPFHLEIYILLFPDFYTTFLCYFILLCTLLDLLSWWHNSYFYLIFELLYYFLNLWSFPWFPLLSKSALIYILFEAMFLIPKRLSLLYKVCFHTILFLFCGFNVIFLQM
jgi:hypothetical protein